MPRNDRMCVLLACLEPAGAGGHVTDVYVDVEQRRLTDGVPVLYRVYQDRRIRLAFDPEQICETDALELARLYVLCVDRITVRRALV